MSEVARRDFSPLVIGTRADATTPKLSSVSRGQPNLLAIALLGCVSEAVAVAASFWGACALCGALLIGFRAPQLWFGILLCVLMVASIAERGDYGPGVMLDCGLRPWSLAKASLQTVGAVLLLVFPWILATGTALEQSAMQFRIAGLGPAALVVLVFSFVGTSYLAVLSTRLIGRVAVAPLTRPRRIAIVGDPACCADLIAVLHQVLGRSTKILGIIDHRDEPPISGSALSVGPKVPVLGTRSELLDIVQRGEVDVVIVALPWLEAAKIQEIVRAVGSGPVDVLLAPDYELCGLRATSSAEYGRLPLLRAIYPPMLGWKAFVKRVEDVVIAGGIALLAAPAILIIAALIKLTSRGPVLLGQQQVGYKGQSFALYRFRTTYTHIRDIPGGEQTRDPNPSLTPIGAWLRRRGLDLLPQLLNVLRGEMSVVGPRPHLKTVTRDETAPEILLRQQVRPGLTGWAQVNSSRGPRHAHNQVADSLTLDLEYIRDWSLPFDLKVIWLTLGLLLNDKNAY